MRILYIARTIFKEGRFASYVATSKSPPEQQVRTPTESIMVNSCVSLGVVSLGEDTDESNISFSDDEHLEDDQYSFVEVGNESEETINEDSNMPVIELQEECPKPLQTSHYISRICC